MACCFSLTRGTFLNGREVAWPLARSLKEIFAEPMNLKINEISVKSYKIYIFIKPHCKHSSSFTLCTSEYKIYTCAQPLGFTFSSLYWLISTHFPVSLPLLDQSYGNQYTPRVTPCSAEVVCGWLTTTWDFPTISIHIFQKNNFKFHPSATMGERRQRKRLDYDSELLVNTEILTSCHHDKDQNYIVWIIGTWR